MAEDDTVEVVDADAEEVRRFAWGSLPPPSTSAPSVLAADAWPSSFLLFSA